MTDRNGKVLCTIEIQPEDITCSICLSTLINPHQCSTYGHNFCKNCIVPSLERGGVAASQCPLCKTHLVKEKLCPNLLVNTLLLNSSIEFYCKTKVLRTSCSWVGFSLEERAQHIQHCGFQITEQCNFFNTSAGCGFLRCSGFVLRSDEGQHRRGRKIHCASPTTVPPGAQTLTTLTVATKAILTARHTEEKKTKSIISSAAAAAAAATTEVVDLTESVETSEVNINILYLYVCVHLGNRGRSNKFSRTQDLEELEAQALAEAVQESIFFASSTTASRSRLIAADVTSRKRKQDVKESQQFLLQSFKRRNGTINRANQMQSSSSPHNGI